MSKKTKLLEPIHPGEILLEEFMRPFLQYPLVRNQ